MQKMIDASVENAVSRFMDKLITFLVTAIVQVVAKQLAQSLANILSVPTSSLFAEICQQGNPNASCPFSPASQQPPTSMDSPMECSPLNSKRRVASHDTPNRSLASGSLKAKRNRGLNSGLETAVSSIFQHKDELGT